MAVWTITKQPTETYPITVDYNTNRFNGTEAGASSSTVAILMSDGTTVTSTVIDSESHSAGVVTLQVKAGTAGEDYKLTVSVTTDESNVYLAEIIMKVRDF